MNTPLSFKFKKINKKPAHDLSSDGRDRLICVRPNLKVFSLAAMGWESDNK